MPPTIAPGNSGLARKSLIYGIAESHGISGSTLWGVFGEESGYGANPGTSSAGAKGDFQFLPSTAAEYGGAKCYTGVLSEQATCAARYLKALGANANPKSTATIKALNAYNGNGGGAKVTSYVQGVWDKGQADSAAKGEVPPSAIPPNAGDVPSDPLSQLFGGITAPFSAIAKVVTALGNPSTYARFGKGLLGGILLIMGAFTLLLIMASKASKTPVGSTVKKAAEVAAIA